MNGTELAPYKVFYSNRTYHQDYFETKEVFNSESNTMEDYTLMYLTQVVNIILQFLKDICLDGFEVDSCYTFWTLE